MFSAATKSKQVSSAANYIEDVFSTYLYTGTGSTQTITNGIDLSGKGGLVWYKSRSDATDHELVDTVRGGTKYIQSNSTSGQGTLTSAEQLSFSSTGFSIGGSNFNGNQSGKTYASWTFRKQPKFFDVVTYTGNGSNRTISHNLGSVPGCIMIKRTDTTGAWAVYHRSLANTEYLVLNTTAAKATGATYWNSTTATSTAFSLGTATDVNANTGTYVAYLFAHDAGGFGSAGTDNVISCGSFTTDSGGNATINLGYEPQWLMWKRSDGVSSWEMNDVMRGMPVTVPLDASTPTATLRANTSAAEVTNSSSKSAPTSTGFIALGGASMTYIYIAIRRGPMKVPTDATKVFAPITGTYGGAGTALTTNFPVDFSLWKTRNAGADWSVQDRLRGIPNTDVNGANLVTNNTTAESSSASIGVYGADNNTSVKVTANATGYSSAYNLFARAPGFFDEVCYTGTGANTTVAHNLGVAPELMIVKSRSNINNWDVYAAPLGNTKALNLESTGAAYTSATNWNNTTPGASTFTLGTNGEVNGSGQTYVAYLFASCPGVSKVGSYTGTGATQTISCGFTGGARFVLIKRTNSTGDWYVWDTARGMVSGTDPSLLLNSTAAEVNANSIYTTTGGFQIVSTAAGINASGGTYIFLAIA